MTYRKIVWHEEQWYHTKVEDSGMETVIRTNTHWPRYKMD